MRILGLCHDVLICSACLVEDGKVVTAVAEERLDRRKMSSVFPEKAIQACLDHAGYTLADIDEIAVAWNPAVDAQTGLSGQVAARRWRTEHFAQIPQRMLQMSGEAAGTTTTQSHLWQDAPPITYVNHYLAHLGNAAYLSPFEKCAVAVLDGRGETMTGMLAMVDGASVDVLLEYPFPHSLGLLYGTFTQFLGFRPDSDEWKVMALGAYADSDNEFYGPARDLLEVEATGTFRLNLDFFEHFNFWDRRMYSDAFERNFGPPRRPNEELTTRHFRIAAALQRVFEETTAQILTCLHERTGVDALAVGGGCFMNCVYNGKITDTTPFNEVFVGSCPDDSGTSIGAALYLHAVRTGKAVPNAVRHNYWGPEFDDDTCARAVQRCKLNASVVEDPAAEAARDLASGKLLGWFQGPMEFGQRALGGRSILADPRDGKMKERVNAAVKYRESFRPFAPAILAERVSEYFDCAPDTSVAFMDQALPVRREKQADIPAVVHEDGTGRLQTVDEHANPRYRRLIECFADETGIPVVLNTSFNLNGEAIVATPDDAIRTFFSCGLDVLYLGNQRVAKAP